MQVLLLFLCVWLQLTCLIVAYSTSYVRFQVSRLSRLAAVNSRDIIVAPIERNFTIFAGVKFWHPVSSALQNLNISKPTPIQSASLVALTTGLSCLLHAETGSGKTLCYLLPILKRLYSNDDKIQRKFPIRALIILPTKELAVQVALDICNLVDGDESVVHLCLSNEKKGFESVSSSIVVGTPYKILQALQVTTNTAVHLSELEYVVLDEIDRLLPVAGRYATNQDKKLIDDRTNPTVELMKYIVELQQINKNDGKESSFQVVAASATVGRPLRRELFKLFNPPSPELKNSKPYVKPDSKASTSSKLQESDDSKNQFHVIRPALSAEDSSTTRRIGIPAGITHVAVMDSQESTELSTKLSIAKHLWLQQLRRKDQSEKQGRGLLFVPSSADAVQALGILRFWGLSEATNLLSSLGIDSHAVLSSEEEKEGEEEDGTGEGLSVPPAAMRAPQPRRSTAELVRLARLSGLGSSSDASIDEKKKPTTAAAASSAQLFVTPVSGSRGLHLQDIDTVLILRPPRTMDEYLHMAGRTGRYGSGHKEGGSTGTVYTIVGLDELKRLQSWQTPLGISFEVEYV